jgi:hypothetical protein
MPKNCARQIAVLLILSKAANMMASVAPRICPDPSEKCGHKKLAWLFRANFLQSQFSLPF